MNKEEWRISRRSEQNFLNDLLGILKRTGKTRVRLLSSEEWVGRYAWAAARRMITGLLAHNARTWRAAAREGMRGREIYEALEKEMRGPVGDRVRELVEENAKLIQTLPQNVAERVTQMVAKYTQEGERAEAFEKLVPSVFEWQARRIARTEASKASTALTQARSELLDIDWYIWRSSEDERVRASHRFMEGVLVRWEYPPSPERLIGEKRPPAPYGVGKIYNCRCYPEPLMRYDQISWPHRVFYNHGIRYMTQSVFRRIAEIEEPKAA